MSSGPLTLAEVCDQLDALDRKHDGLVRQNRVLKLMVLAIPGLALTLGAAYQPSADITDKLVARGLAIVDEAGKEVVTIGSNRQGGTLAVRDSAGRERITLGLGDADAGNPAVAVLSETGKKLIAMFIHEEHGPRFTVAGENTPIAFFEVGLAVENGVPFFQLIDENGKLILGHGGRALAREGWNPEEQQ